MTTTVKKTLTPLEKLRLDKLACKQKEKELEARLNDNFSYIRTNSGSIILSALVSPLFSREKKKESSTNSLFSLIANINGKSPLSNYLSVGYQALPYVWTIAKPIVLAWGIGKIESVLVHSLFGKKKKEKKKKVNA